MTRNQIIGVVIIALVSFAAGRYTVPVKVVTETKVVEVEKKNVEVQKKQAKKKKTTIVVVKKPNGESKTTTTIDEDTKTDKDFTLEDTKKKESETQKEVVKDHGALTIYGIAELDHNEVVYGLGIQKSILGPITLGIFGLSSGTAGCTLGLTF